MMRDAALAKHPDFFYEATNIYRCVRKIIVVRPCDTNISKTLQLAEEMILLADQGDADREDAGCGIMYGILRDSAYRLKKIAEQEKEAHIQKGWWRGE